MRQSFYCAVSFLCCNLSWYFHLVSVLFRSISCPQTSLLTALSTVFLLLYFYFSVINHQIRVRFLYFSLFFIIIYSYCEFFKDLIYLFEKVGRGRPEGEGQAESPRSRDSDHQGQDPRICIEGKCLNN